MHFKISAICFNLDQSKTLSSGNGLKQEIALISIQEGYSGKTCQAHVTLTYPNETFKWHIYSLMRTIVQNYFEINP